MGGGMGIGGGDGLPFFLWDGKCVELFGRGMNVELFLWCAFWTGFGIYLF